jgi:hypothetical protein
LQKIEKKPQFIYKDLLNSNQDPTQKHLQAKIYTKPNKMVQIHAKIWRIQEGELGPPSEGSAPAEALVGVDPAGGRRPPERESSGRRRRVVFQ